VSRRTQILAVVLIVTLVVSFFYLRALGRRIFFESAPRSEEAVHAQLSEAALRAASGPSQTVTLYFPALDRKQLMAEQRPIALAAADTDRIRQILLALMEGSRLGYTSPLPPSTEARAVFLTSEGTVYLDFSSQALANLAPGIASETLTVYAIVNSLAANVPTVKRVKILVEGQEADTLDGHADLSNDYVPNPALNAPAS